MEKYMEKLEELQLYIGMTTIPKSWISCYQDSLKKFKKDWILEFDFKEVCNFYGLPSNFLRTFIRDN